MKAIGIYVLVEPIEEASRMEGSIMLTSEDAKEIKYRRGRVISAGSECIGIEDGAEISYDINAGGHTIMKEGQRIAVIRYRDVVVVW